MNQLTSNAARLLQDLVQRIDQGRIVAGRPETYPRYGEVHDALGLEMQGETVGQSLKRQGLADLAEWTHAHSHPAITGLIVSGDSLMPGLGYFELFGREETDFNWWNDEIASSLSYNWRPFIQTHDEPPPTTPQPPDLAPPPPERVACSVYRVLRDTELARRVKRLHDYRCQICGHSIQLPDGSYYAEAHHIQPLGIPHNGPDVTENILCVCPNHHAELDYAVIDLIPSQLRAAVGHTIGAQYVRYHTEVIRS